MRLHRRQGVGGVLASPERRGVVMRLKAHRGDGYPHGLP
jgi:hypothetical protein